MESLRTLAVVALLVLAGCTGALPGGDAATDESTLRVYVSDDPGVIDRFEHVNVTVTEFSVRAASSPGDHDDSGRHRHRHHGDWTTYDLNATTVDLTELRGANASLLHAVGVPDGEYTAVSVTVTDVNATLEGGERVDVRVPDSRLLVEQEFTVGGTDSVDFVVDAVVRERGDGEYVVAPNTEQSGTSVDIRQKGGCDCCHGGHHGNWNDDGTMHEGGHHNETKTGSDGCRHG